MSGRLLISALPGETRAAWLADGRLEELVILRADRPQHLGDVYLGRVMRLDRSLEAAFVEIGLERPGFLPLDLWPGKGLSEGDAVLVQVTRAPSDGKGAKLSGRIAPRPAGLEQLAKAAQGTTGPPSRLLQGQDPIARVLAAKAPPEAIVVDDPEVFRTAQARFAAAGSAHSERVSLYTGAQDLFEREGVEAVIEALLEPRVALPSGGALLIEPVSSMTAVDVDSGAQSESGGAARRALAVDLEAADAIPRQVRLRNLSGLLVIDFLPLPARADRQTVVAKLRAGLKTDREPTRAAPMSSSGLVELTRRRGGPALHERMTVPQGSGRDPVALAYAALRRLRA
ncbi:MAG: ribonuclease E/G, partial [Kiloniellales bacterium]